MKTRAFSLIVCLHLLAALVVSSFAQEFTVKQIMADPSMAGMRPDSEQLSPDGTKVVFAWNESGKDPKNIYLWDGSGPAKIILKPSDFAPAFPGFPPGGAGGGGGANLNYGLNMRDEFSRRNMGAIGGLAWSPDSKRLMFTQSGDLWVMTIGSSEKPKRLTKTQSPEFFARWVDNRRIAFSQSGNIFIVDLEQFSLVQLTRESNPALFISVGNSAISKDGSIMAYATTDNSKQRALIVPNYLGDITEANPFRRGFSSGQKLYVTKTDGSTDRVMEMKLPAPEANGYIRGLNWTADNRSLIVDRIDRDLKRRQIFYIYNAGAKDEKIITVTEETDNKWIAPLSRMIEPHPKDSGKVLFTSERDGYNHIYLATLERAGTQPNPTGEIRQENPSGAGFTDKVDTKQLTKGNWQVEWVEWQRDGKAFFYNSTEAGTEIREFYAMWPDQNTPAVKVGTGDKAMKISPQMSEAETNPQLLYSGSKWNAPTELFTVNMCPACRNIPVPTQLTNSTPEAFKKINWTVPQFIDIKSKDGKAIKSKIYLPPGHNPSNAKKYPMVIFVHGAGYLQNTINGWNNYYREFMFNDMMAKKGYVVLDIDFRGSAGYGRDWRTDVHDFLGGLDYEDHIDAIDHMVKTYGVNQSKIGVYGGSYGGFMAEMLAMRAPDRIAAAAALRPVADWKNYFASSPIYTAERLGFPDKNPEAYKRSSPIAYADKLERPLLMLHGMLDDNVHAQDTIQLAEKLIRLGKTEHFEMMLYPSENHAFTRPESWTDEYQRILMFFEKHLR